MHTPGPYWPDLNRGTVHAPTGEIVAHVNLVTSPFSIDTLLDNQTLLAAAPELLAALEQVKEAFAKLANIAGDVPEWNRGGFAYTASKTVKAAIAKAKGETP